MSDNLNLLEWTALEYEHRNRSLDWLWSVGLAAVLVALVLLYFGNFLFGVIVVLAAGIVILFSKRPPQEVHFAITSKGLKAGRELYLFSSIKDFSIPKDNSKLIIESSRAFLPRITLPLNQSNASQVRPILKRFIKEDEYEERFLDALADRLGF